MDTEQLELTQLNEKILQCLQLYDSLMQDQLSTMNSSYMPQLTNSMASMSMQVNSAISSFDNEKNKYAPGQQYAPQQVHQYSQGYQPVETPQPAEMNQHINQQAYQSQMQSRGYTMGNLPPNASAQNMFATQPQANFHPQQQQYFTPPPSAYSTGSPYNGPYEPTAPPPTPPVTDASLLQHHQQVPQHQQQAAGAYQQQPMPSYQAGIEPPSGGSNQAAPPTQAQNLL